MAEENNLKKTSTSNGSSSTSIILGVLVVVLGILVVVLGFGGYMGWKVLNHGNAVTPKISESRSEAGEQEERVIYPLESFIVNLMDQVGSGKRYLKVTIELEIGREEDKDILKRHTTQIRDATLLLLSSQSYSQINTVEGKLDLKRALLSRINQVVGDGMVHRLYFTEFVVQ